MRNEHFLRTFLLLTACTGYLLAFSFLGVYAYEKVVGGQDTFKPGTQIASLNVSDVPKASVKEKVAESIDQWMMTEAITIRFKEKSESLPMEIYSFSVEDTSLQVEEGTTNPVAVSVNKKLLSSFLASFLGGTYVKKIDQAKLQQDLQNVASSLKSGQKVYQLEAYIADNELEVSTIFESSVPVTDDDFTEVRLWVDEVNEIEVSPQSKVSLIEVAEQVSLSNLSKESLSLIASSIYETIAHSNFDILERHVGNVIPKQVTPGFEARVEYDKLDLLFFNPNYTAYTITFEMNERQLITRLVGQPFFYEYEAVIKEQQEYEPKTIVQYTAMLPPNVTNFEEMGKNGLWLKVYRDISSQGSAVKSVLLSEDFYPPIHRIEQRGLILEKEEPSTSTDDEATVDDDATDQETDEQIENDNEQSIPNVRKNKPEESNEKDREDKNDKQDQSTKQPSDKQELEPPSSLEELVKP
ncbi:VanW family protein [Bacillus sp. CGMCC 1.16541]|uniref:VanW family protein n=1 Tax=Bacillus sp. CGMCC 1.16541 TaxID=2185143 RepID=UPI000D725876|nr:VanW family protein [Bacillus sp. CGMCC 1.16541]